MSLLPSRLLTAAQLFTRAVREQGEHAMLIGGGAVLSLGHNRSTRDVDFNVSKMSKTMRKNIEKNNMRIIIVPHRDRKDRFAATLLESAPGMLDATKIDIAVNTNLSKLLPFTVEIDGVTVVGPHLLLVNKIRCSAERKGNVDVRVHNDLSDIMFLLNHIMDNNLGYVPLELVHILDADIWERFWSRVDDYAREDRILYETLMIELGLPCL